MHPYLWLTLAFLLNATAGLLVKHSTTFMHLGLFSSWMPTAYARIIIYSIFCLALSFVFFNLAARVLPISIVYSVHVGMSLLILTFFAWLLLGEKLSSLQYIGITILILGMVLINIGDINEPVPNKKELNQS